MLTIGFLNNQIDNRGTGNALFDYAHYNEEILGNRSVIFTKTFEGQDEGMTKRLIERFGRINHWFDYLVDSPIDAMYHIKYGNADQILPKVPYLVHAVFDAGHPHGTRYAAVSRWLGERDGVPWVPHIVSLPDTDINLRARLDIPEDAIVFGRYGGKDSFDIPFVWEAIDDTIMKYDDVFFLFMNTDNVPEDLQSTGQVISFEATADPIHKREFINTCNAMIHARSRGETFGLAVGEFAVCGRPVITYGDSPERAHLENLQNYYPYWDKKSLVDCFEAFTAFPLSRMYGYVDFTPESVMARFKEVFLDGVT